MENSRAYSKALKRINACVAENATTLDLSNLGLKKIPKEVGKCDWITNLDLSRNEITEIKGLEQLVGLQMLNLSSNQITEIKGLEQMVGLQSLDLYNNQITEIKGLEQMVGLQKLDLSFNQITEIKGLEKMVGLQMLHLSRNQITEIKGLDKMVGLQSLDLYNNQITKIKGLEQMVGLQTLILSGNQVESLDELMLLTRLKAYIDIDDNPVLRNLPAELVGSGWPSIKDWLLATQMPEAFIRIYEVKLLLLGNTNVGKSNLLHFFETGNYEYSGDSTHGIQYRMLSNLVEGVNLNCWDFGGQEFYHATHQLFFSPGALHLVLWSKGDVPRGNQNPETCFDLKYWLRCIEQLIGRKKEDIEEEQTNDQKTSTLICENKINLLGYKTTLLNQQELQSAFNDLELSFTAINLRPPKYTEGLKEIIAEKVSSLTHEWPPFYTDYLKKIRESKQPFLLVNDVFSNATDDSVERVRRTMKVFNNMGLVLYFSDIISDKVFTKPQVLLDLLYEKVLRDKTKDNITYEQIKKAVDNNNLKLSVEEVTKLLLEFDLVFQIPDEPKVYFIPQYLSAPSSLFDFFRKHQFGQTNIRIASDNFLMNVAMLRVFGEYGQYVKKDRKQEHLFWKDGIVIEKGGMLLMVKFDRANQCIELYPDNNNNNFALQKEVVKFILDIPERQDIEKQEKRLIREGKTRTKEIRMIRQQFEVERDEMDWQSAYFKVFVSLDGKFFTRWHTIVQQVEQGIFQVQAVEETMNEKTKELVRKVKTVSVFDYNKYLPEKDKGQIKKIFISYSKKDTQFEMTNGVKVDFKAELETHLKQLNRLGLADTWSDTNLLAGGDWDGEIKKKLEEADIILFLVSANLIGTDYVWDEEMPLAKFHKEYKKAVLIPVILTPCLWTSIPLFSESNAVPHKGLPVSSYNVRDDAYDEIARKIKAVLER